MAETEHQQVMHQLARMGRRLQGAANAEDFIAATRPVVLDHKEPFYEYHASLVSSDNEVSAEDIGEIENAIQAVRGFIFGFGIKGAELPGYTNFIKLGWRSFEELEGYHMLKMSDPFTEVVAEEQEIAWNNKAEPIDRRLAISVIEGEREIAIEFGFNHDFQFTLTQVDVADNVRIEATQSKRRDLKTMTEGEHRIITYYLDLLIEQQEQRLRNGKLS